MSDLNSVWVALVELRPLEGCEHHDPAKINGAFARCYIPARSREDALEFLKRVLDEDSYELVNIEWCYRHDEVEWENPDPKQSEMIAEALEPGEFTYGTMDVWGHDAPDAV